MSGDWEPATDDPLSEKDLALLDHARRTLDSADGGVITIMGRDAGDEHRSGRMVSGVSMLRTQIVDAYEDAAMLYTAVLIDARPDGDVRWATLTEHAR